MNNSEVWYQRGAKYYREDNYKQAIQSFKHSLDFDPNFVESMRHLGEIFYNQGDYKKALNILNKALKIEPNDSFTWYELSLVYNKIKEYDNAIDACIKALDNFSIEGDEEVYLFLGELYVNKAIEEEDRNKAHNILLEAAYIFRDIIEDFDPNSIYYRFKLGEIYSVIGYYDDAVSSYLKVIEIDPNFYLAWFRLAQTYLDAGEYDKAMNSCKKGLSIRPDYNQGIELKAIIKDKQDNLYYRRFKKVQEKFQKIKYKYKRQNEVSFEDSEKKKEFVLKDDYKRSFEELQVKTEDINIIEKKNKARDLLDNFETTIRVFLSDKLNFFYGKEWWEISIPKNIRERAEKRFYNKKKDEPKRDYKKIDFINFSDYYQIISTKKNWEKIFSNIFNRKKYKIQTYFEEIANIRNDLAHVRFNPEDLIKLKTFIKETSKFISK